jgi:hypothetical protein
LQRSGDGMFAYVFYQRLAGFQRADAASQLPIDGERDKGTPTGLQAWRQGSEIERWQFLPTDTALQSLPGEIQQGSLFIVCQFIFAHFASHPREKD